MSKEGVDLDFLRILSLDLGCVKCTVLSSFVSGSKIDTFGSELDLLGHMDMLERALFKELSLVCGPNSISYLFWLLRFLIL